ncbi:MAG: hypothetical protein WCG75_10940, partial [Armatimonadota bacterium]
MISRRDLLKHSGQAAMLASTPLASAIMTREVESGPKAIRCINIVNFIRAIEPRFQTDLLLPVQKQMEIIKGHNFPATWLLQFDALVSGPFVKYLKENMAESHEVGFWFEMNEMHCNAAGVKWRGRPGYEWDHYPNVAFTIGYSPEERIKLADTAMNEFKKVWGKYPKSVASWNLDAITCAHLVDKYKVEAFAVCRDQIATDGFTIWGAPIAGYYPSKTNCWSPAVNAKNQINAPIFRMLGQDPVYYYNREYTMPDGKRHSAPDTMEPVWPSGRSTTFVQTFLDMIGHAPTGQFAYAQLGQENSFPWPEQEPGYAPQFKALAAFVKNGTTTIETMGASGRRFKKAFRTTPVQAQVQLTDPFGNTSPEERSVWYQSRFYRANLHFKGNLPFLRDITVYSDEFPQPFLQKATTSQDVEQKMPPVLDGYHWRKDGAAVPGAGGFFESDGIRLRMNGNPRVSEEGNILVVGIPFDEHRILVVRFEERAIDIHILSVKETKPTLSLEFEWDPKKASLASVSSNKATFKL